jgi:hypothetical protein
LLRSSLAGINEAGDDPSHPANGFTVIATTMCTSPEPLVLMLRPQTDSERRRHYLRVLTRPRVLAVLLFVALLPALVDRTVALLIPSGRLSPSLVAAGFAGLFAFLCFLFVVLDAIARVRSRAGQDAGFLVFDDAGLREVHGSRTERHAWSWVAEAWERDQALVLSFYEPHRTLRPSRGGRSLVVALGTSDAERLQELLAVHRPDLLSRL